ncbi:hypothetical protein [Methylobacterium sp. WL69]|jgi:hypothetical protein|uniref:hypothetical protein n=1 Tax=Methylobacterium sp. WL69 TaxID=2603893 RepID=UPI00164F2BC3|nr:hypothetical protein [Methylobacterium sp. WL69]
MGSDYPDREARTRILDFGRLERTGASHRSEGAGPRRRRAYARAGYFAAIEDGLMPDEIRQILAGRTLVDAFPVWNGESLAAYAERAVAEMMVAYLGEGGAHSALLRDGPA